MARNAGRLGSTWKVMSTEKPTGADGDVAGGSRMKRTGERMEQIFEEAWRYEKDLFLRSHYARSQRQEVHDRYAPLIPTSGTAPT